MLKKVINKSRRAGRIRSSLSSSSTRPRLSVFRSNSHISVQVIDDSKAVTLCSANDASHTSGTKSEKASLVGKEIATKMKELGISQCVFDRGGNLYHWRVKLLAESVREAGIQF